MDEPEGSAKEDEKILFERLNSTYSSPGSEFGAYLRFFREVSARERLDLTRLEALFVGADGPWESRSSPPSLSRGVVVQTFLG
jgi:hypothetical protein